MYQATFIWVEFVVLGATGSLPAATLTFTHLGLGFMEDIFLPPTHSFKMTTHAFLMTKGGVLLSVRIDAPTGSMPVSTLDF